MNWRNFLLVIVFTLGCFTSQAQSNLLNAKTPADIGKKTPAQLISDNDKPLPYGYVHDRDILMGKTTWETIDLDERINFPLYYPIDTANIGKERRSLYDVLTSSIMSGKITEVYTDSYFNTKKTVKDIMSSLEYTKLSDAGSNQINDLNIQNKYPNLVAGITADDKVNLIKDGIKEEYLPTTTIASIDVSQYKIKGYWYFDKRLSELKYRLIGICPVVPDVFTMGTEEQDYIELFWVYFPSIRDILHEAKAFNNRNSAMPIDFDTLLNARKFNGVIYQEENVQGDRTVEDYMKDNAQMQLLESDRIKDKIRDFEQDMWNY